MIAQTELFPADEADRAQAVLSFLIERKEKAEKSLATAEENLAKIELLIEKQRHLLRLLRDHSVTQTRVETEEVEDAEVVEEEPERPALDGVAEQDGIAYETATGEVVRSAEEEAPWEYGEPAGRDEESAA